METHVIIASLPLRGEERAVLVEAAKDAFERVVERMEPQNEDLTRSLWSPEYYVDKLLLTEDMLPISRDYAASLIDAFLVHHVLDLALEADQLARKQPALH